ncbi:MAG: hypothetical protein KDD37_08965, partial [Bdellovibrionales bacterium]|nr:hypothetical protein [Bdellovibrionales bacterium]
PAKEGFDSNYHRILFTSYMDHPINQTHAAVVANDYYLKHPHKKEICGLRSDLAFFGNPYLEYFNTSNNSFTLSEDGHGIGFTSLLEREKWKTLIG